VTKARKGTKTNAPGRASDKPSETVEKNNSQAMTVMGTEEGHINKIRDILFGRQMADYEARFNQLEDRITSQIEALRQETDDGLKDMKGLLQKQNEMLTERLKDEESKRGQEGQTLSRELAKAEKTLSKTIDALAAQQVQDAQSLSEQLSALSHELSDGLYIQQKEAADNLEQAVRELGDAKLARTTLSQMLVEMAGRLSDATD
jgi:exonuclease VII large subunit